jgi:hypothetical protein
MRDEYWYCGYVIKGDCWRTLTPQQRERYFAPRWPSNEDDDQ